MNNRHPAFTRRTFLTTAVAGLAASSSYARKAGPIRAGLIGYGETGQSLLRTANAQKLPLDIRVIAETDSRRRAAVPAGMATSASWESIVEDKQLDALLIATPDHFHFSMAHAALVAGKRVYLLPPLARSIEEGALLQEAAKRHPAQLYVAMDTASFTHWALCKSNLDPTSTPRWIQADIPNPPARSQGHRSHHIAHSNGDAATALFSALYPLLHTFGLGTPQQCTALGGVFETDKRETPDTLSFSAEFEKGLRITLTTKPPGTKQMPTVIRGSGGSIEIPAPNATPDFDLGPWARSLHNGESIQDRCLDAALIAHFALCDALV